MAYRRAVHAALWHLLAATPTPPDLPIPENRTGPVVAAFLAIVVVGAGVIIAGVAKVAAAERRRLSRAAAARATGHRRSR